MAKNKKNYIAVIVAIFAFFLIATGIASWIISISSGFTPQYSIKGEVMSQLDTSTVTYDGVVHLPIPLDSNTKMEDSFEISFKSVGDDSNNMLYTKITFNEGYPNTGPVNAGNYLIKYTRLSDPEEYAEIPFVIDKVKLTLTAEQLPTLSDTIYGFAPSITKNETVSVVDTSHISQQTVTGKFVFDEDSNIETAAYNGNEITSQNTASMIFKPNEEFLNNYYPIEVNVPYTMNAVAKIGSTYYGRIEDALSASNSGDIVIALIGKNPTIFDDCTVKSGVTLLIGYDDIKFNENREGTNKFFADSNIENVNTYRKNNVTINSGVTLTVDGGTLNIDGVLGSAGQGLSGATTGNYAQITLDSNAKINLLGGAIFNCYGYVKEKAQNNGSKVNFLGTTVNMPFVIYDYRGGTNTVTVYMKGGIAPFSVFDMPNIQTEFFIYYKGESSSNVTATGPSTIYGLVDLYANDAHNTDKIPIFSSDSSVSGVLNLTSGYIKTKYIPYTLGISTKDLDTTKIEVHGSGHTATLTLTIKVMITVTVSMEQLFFGISYKFDIGFYDGTFTIQNKYKLLTGVKVYIDESAIVNIDNGGEVIIYSRFNDKSFGGYIYPQKEAAQVVVDGILNIKTGSLAGIVATSNTGAQLNVSSSSGIELTSIEGNSGTTSSSDAVLIGMGNTGNGEFIIGYVATENLRGLTVSSGSNYSAFSSGNYKSLNGRWYSETCIIYYDANGGILTGNAFEPSSGSYTTPHTITKISTTNPIRDYYEFVGWYIDINCTIPLYTYNPQSKLYTLHSDQGQNIIYCNTYVYAKWEPINYNIEYEYIYSGCEETGSISGALTTFNILTNQSLLTPMHSKNYEFGGWFTDKEHTNPIGTIVGSEYVSSGAKFYGLWYPEGTETYTISYEMINNTDPEFIWESKKIISFDTGSYTHWDDCSKYNNDKAYPKFFDNWYIDEKCTVVFDKTKHLDSSRTLYGNWIDKHVVTLNWGGFGSNSINEISYYIQNNGAFTFPDYTFELEDNTSYIAEYIGKWSDGTNQFDVNTTSPSIQETITYTLTKVESGRYYKVTLRSYYSNVTLTLSNGSAITGINDTNRQTKVELINTEQKELAKFVYIKYGTTISCAFEYRSNWYNGYEIKNSTSGTTIATNQKTYGKPSNPATFKVEQAEYSIGSSSSSASGGCVLPNANIMMPDGSTKLVSEIKVGDVIKTWSFEEGKLVDRPVIFVEHLENVLINKITLFFDDGTSIDLAYGQSYFDINSLEFFSINAENVSEHIGKTIMGFDNNNVSYKTIVDYSVEIIISDAYELITGYDFSFIYDNVLSMEPFLLYKLPFDITNEFKYDEDRMISDINKYGLYTYEDWNMYVSEELFELLNGKYFKVAIEKGHFTKEYLIQIIEKYLTEDNLSKK